MRLTEAGLQHLPGGYTKINRSIYRTLRNEKIWQMKEIELEINKNNKTSRHNNI